eukprot:3748922-Pyramimonas_sp.AAC.1
MPREVAAISEVGITQRKGPSSWNALGTLLSASWGRIGVVVGLVCVLVLAVPGASWSVSGASEIMLESFGGLLGAGWKPLGTSWWPFGRLLGLF